MKENNVKDTQAMRAIIENINKIDGFDPSVFVKEFADLSTGDKRKHLPVMIQLAWFYLKHPEGKVAVNAVQEGASFVARAKVYAHYKDGENEFLSEATASRSPISDKPSVSAREWAQTAAIGVALRNAGFGLQFDIDADEVPDGTSPEQTPQNTTDGSNPFGTSETPAMTSGTKVTPVQVELTPEEKYKQALTVACPISKFSGKTLGDLLLLDPGALSWIAEKFQGSDAIKSAAITICEYAKKHAVA